MSALRSGLQPHKPRAASEREVATFEDLLKMLLMNWDEGRFAIIEI